MEGSAASCIQGLTLSEANYDAAMTMLQERFGRPQQIITADMEELLRIGSTGDCPTSLGSTFDKIVHLALDRSNMVVCSFRHNIEVP